MATIVQSEVNLNPAESADTLNPADRDIRVAELAYYKAEKRGFDASHELDDWLEAERELMQ